MTDIDQYIFWNEIGYIANNLDDLSEYRENKWLENFLFKKEDFKNNIQLNIQNLDNLLENITKLKIKQERSRFKCMNI